MRTIKVAGKSQIPLR